jgi:hypothetical protein
MFTIVLTLAEVAAGESDEVRWEREDDELHSMSSHLPDWDYEGNDPPADWDGDYPF